MSSTEEELPDSQQLMLPPAGSQSKTTPRKRGAPRGNKNALKHGFYARNFTYQEIADIDDRKPISVTDEINLIRIFMRRVIASFDASNSSQQDLLDTFRALCLGNMTLARLIRLHLLPAMINQSSDSLSEILSQVLNDIQQKDQSADDQTDNLPAANNTVNPTTD